MFCFNRSCCGRSRKRSRHVRLRHSALLVTVHLLASVHPPVCPRPPLGPVGHWHAQGMRRPQRLARRLRCESLPRGLGQWRCPRLKLKKVPGSALLCLWDAAPIPLHTPPPRAPGLIWESQGYVLPTHTSAVRFTQDLWRGFGSWKTKTKRVSEWEWEREWEGEELYHPKQPTNQVTTPSPFPPLLANPLGSIPASCTHR